MLRGLPTPSFNLGFYFFKLGNIETRENKPGQISRNVELRNELDLFAYVMNCKSFPGIQTRHKDIDILIIRQNTEGEYAMLEHEVVDNLKHFFKFEI